MTSCFVLYDVIYYPFLPCQFSIFEDVGGGGGGGVDSPAPVPYATPKWSINITVVVVDQHNG